jgi:hypothetical protein
LTAHTLKLPEVNFQAASASFAFSFFFSAP